MKQKYKSIILISTFVSLFGFGFASVFVDEDSSNWVGYSNTCASAETNHISVTPTTIPTVRTGNTIYDFAAGTYNLSAGISINEPCTALIGTETSLLVGNGSPVININSPYTIIKNFTINGVLSDGINLTTSSATLDNLIVFNSNRGILLTASSNSIIKNTKVFGNAIGISLTSNSNGNIINNIISFNNSQHGILINGGSKNTINNSIFTNNAAHGIYFQVGSQNILNNSLSINNNSNGLRIIAAGNYINNSIASNNTSNIIIASTTGFGIISSDINLPVGMKLGLSSNFVVGSLGWQNGFLQTGVLVTGTNIFNPHDGTNLLINTSSSISTRKGPKPFGTTLSLANSLWGQQLPYQISPVQWNTAGTQIVASSLSFSASKKIGEYVATAGGTSDQNNGGGSSPRAVCGNALQEAGEECDDGNKWNGDGCTPMCLIENQGICGNGLLEYKEWCDDGNILANDGCSSTCQLETDVLVLTPKQLLQQTALQKTLGTPSALINTRTISTVADFILSTITQHQKQQTEQCQYSDINYRDISFTDQSPYQKQIETLLNYCIVQGKGTAKQRTFGNKDATTYSEFIKVLVKAHFIGSSVDFHNNSFDIQNIYSDVTKTAWYAPYIIKAYVHDLLIPIEKSIGKNTNILPEKTITKLEAIKLLIHSLKLANKNPNNIESITDTFKDANTPLTREEMAALIVYGYQLDYTTSLKLKSNNGLLLTLLAKQIRSFPQKEQLILLQNTKNRISNIDEAILKKQNIYKKEFLADISSLIDFSEVFLK